MLSIHNGGLWQNLYVHQIINLHEKAKNQPLPDCEIDNENIQWDYFVSQIAGENLENVHCIFREFRLYIGVISLIREIWKIAISR